MALPVAAPFLVTGLGFIPTAHSLPPASTACEIFPPNDLLRVTSQHSLLCGSGLIQSFLEWKGP